MCDKIIRQAKQTINTKLKMVANSGRGDKEEVEITRVHKSFECLIY